jgi:AcrR family transcriptional regulator
MERSRSSSHEGRMSGEERRAYILAQSKKVFAQSGYAQTSIGDLARASQVTEALLYKHFESKQQLYLTVLQEVKEHFLSSFRERVQERAQRDPLEALSSLLPDYRAVAIADPESLPILLRASIEANAIPLDGEPYTVQIYTLVFQLLQEAQQQALLPTHLDLNAAAWGFFSFLFALGERVKRHMTDQVTEQTLREMNRLWLHALRTG